MQPTSRKSHNSVLLLFLWFVINIFLRGTMWLLLWEDFLFLFLFLFRESGIFPGLFGQVVTTSRGGEGGDKYTDTLHPTHTQPTLNTCLRCTLHSYTQHTLLLQPPQIHPHIHNCSEVIYYLQVSYWYILKRENRCISTVQQRLCSIWDEERNSTGDFKESESRGNQSYLAFLPSSSMVSLSLSLSPRFLATVAMTPALRVKKQVTSATTNTTSRTMMMMSATMPALGPPVTPSSTGSRPERGGTS